MTLRQRIISFTGPRAAHALQDGFTIGSMLGLTITFKFAVIVMLSALGIDGIKPRKLLRKADQFVREEQIRENPEYFVIGLLSGSGTGAFVGTVLRVAYEASGYSVIPDTMLMIA